MKTVVEPSAVFQWPEEVFQGTGQHVRSPLSLGGYDKGIVTGHPGRVTYRSNVNNLVLDGVVDVRLIEKSFPWGPFLAVAAFGGWLAIGRAVVALPVLALLLLIYRGVRREVWVEVVPADGGRTLCFMAGSQLWESSNARTQRLYQKLCKVVLPNAGDGVVTINDSHSGAPH